DGGLPAMDVLYYVAVSYVSTRRVGLLKRTAADGAGGAVAYMHGHPDDLTFYAMTADTLLPVLDEPAATRGPKKVYIETYGCQMNAADSEIVLSVMNRDGYEPTSDIEAADVVFLN